MNYGYEVVDYVFYDSPDKNHLLKGVTVTNQKT